MAKFNEKSARQLADEYGFAYAFLKSDGSLWRLFKSAVKSNWSAEKFAAKLRNTSWYQKNAESVRQYQLLSKTDPATLRQRKLALMAQIQDAGAQLGAKISSGQLSKIVDNALKYNWNEAQVRNILADHVKAINGIYMGDTGDAIDNIRKTAWSNGLRISEHTIQNYAQNIAKGNWDAEYVQNMLRRQAMATYPAYADELKAGMDMYDVASAYRETMAKTLEMNPADIDMFDSTIRQAFMTKDAQGKPSSKTLWQFEEDLKRDKRWLGTQNAQDSIMATARSVLKDFGLEA